MGKKAAKKPPGNKTPAKKTRPTSAATKVPAKRAAKKPATKDTGKKPASKRTPAKKPATKDTGSKARGHGQATSAAQGGVPGFELDVRIADIEPEIWRHLHVPATVELCDLHLALQLAFDWENCHAHQFSIGVRSYGPEGTPEAEDYDGLRLSDVVKPSAKIVYEYDFGDGWEHIIRVLKPVSIPDSQPRFSCLDGARRGPVEDCGGPAGYAMLLDDLADPSSEQHDEAVELAGENFDPEAFDRTQTNSALAELDRRLRAAESGGPATPGADAAPSSDLVLLFETGEGQQLRVVELPDVIVKADAAMLDKLATFFGVAARAVREHGRSTPDIYLSDFLSDEENHVDIIVTQDG